MSEVSTVTVDYVTVTVGTSWRNRFSQFESNVISITEPNSGMYLIKTRSNCGKEDVYIGGAFVQMNEPSRN